MGPRIFCMIHWLSLVLIYIACSFVVFQWENILDGKILGFYEILVPLGEILVIKWWSCYWNMAWGSRMYLLLRPNSCCRLSCRWLQGNNNFCRCRHILVIKLWLHDVSCEMKLVHTMCRFMWFFPNRRVIMGFVQFKTLVVPFYLWCIFVSLILFMFFFYRLSMQFNLNLYAPLPYSLSTI